MNPDRLVLGSIGITPVGRVQRGWAIKVSINLRVINAPRLLMKPRVARTMIGEDGNRAVTCLDVIEKKIAAHHASAPSGTPPSFLSDHLYRAFSRAQTRGQG